MMNDVKQAWQQPRRLVLGLVVAGLVACCGVALILRLRGPRLKVLTFGGDGPPTLVLLHGYGSSAARWEPFTRTIWHPPTTRFVFPDGPEATRPPDGPLDGRAWWRLDLAAHIAPGQSIPDLSRAKPPGLRVAAGLVREVLQHVRRGAVVLGGFSQGAMVASEVTFMSDARVDSLVLLSGTIVDEPSWAARLALRRGLPVFIAHGRADAVLPFDVADRFRARLQAAGLNVTWYPFDGGHEIPAEVVGALNEFLRRVLPHGVG